MTRRKSLKGNRQAQRNYMAKELQKKQYQGRKEKVRTKYDRKSLKDIPYWEPEE